MTKIPSPHHSRTRFVAGVVGLALVVAIAPQAEGSMQGSAAVTAPAADPASPPAPGPQYTGRRIQWKPLSCPAVVYQLAAIGDVLLSTDCGTFQAPLDYHHPEKGSITIGITRVRKFDPLAALIPSLRKPKRALFTNPGGPGAAGYTVPPSAPIIYPALLGSHDIYGVDPRGTGMGRKVLCPELNLGVTDSRDLSDANVAKMRAGAKTFVESCAAANKDVMPYITTEQTVRDQDLARQLIGQNQIDWLGVSGGTWMGRYYQHFFPTRSGRFVLDSNAEFTAVWQETFLQQPRAFQRRFDEMFLAWVARQNATYGLGTTAADVDAKYEQIRAGFAAGRFPGGTPDLVDGAIAQTMYSSDSFAQLATAFKDSVATLNGSGSASTAVNDFKGIVEATEEIDPEPWQLPVFLAITCNDTDWTRDPAFWVDFARTHVQQYPLIAGQFATSLCDYWPFESVDLPPANSVTLPPALMVQSTYDPATALAAATEAHAVDPSTRMVTLQNEGDHGVFFTLRQSTCLTAPTLNYLRYGNLPADKTCEAVPMPSENRVFPVGPQDPNAQPTSQTIFAPDLLRSLLAAVVGLAYGRLPL